MVYSLIMSNRIINPRTEFYAAEHFLNQANITTTNNPYGVLGFINSVTNGGNISTISLDNNIMGMQQLSTGGSASNGTASCIIGLSSILFSGGYWKTEFHIRIPTLSTSSERFIIYMGFINSGTGASSNGVYTKYSDNVSSGVWTICNTLSGGEGVSGSSTAVTANTWHRVEIVINAAGNYSYLYVNGIFLVSRSGNIPTATEKETGLGFSIIKSVGTTARTLDIDWCDLYFRPTTQIV